MIKKHIRLEFQPDAMDCGPSCLGMIATWHGRKYSWNIYGKGRLLAKKAFRY